MERTSVVKLSGGQDLGSLFSDLIRLETELWDLVEARLHRDHDLALSWFEPMQVIDSTPGCRVIDIAEALSITIGGTSKLVDRIENAGWCERSPNPDDGRSSTIRLTRAGRRVLTAARDTFTDDRQEVPSRYVDSIQLDKHRRLIHQPTNGDTSHSSNSLSFADSIASTSGALSAGVSPLHTFEDSARARDATSSTTSCSTRSR